MQIGVGIGMALLGESLSASAWLGLGCAVAGVAAITPTSRQHGRPQLAAAPKHDAHG